MKTIYQVIYAGSVLHDDVKVIKKYIPWVKNNHTATDTNGENKSIDTNCESNKQKSHHVLLRYY